MNEDDLLKRLDQEYVFISHFIPTFRSNHGKFNSDDKNKFNLWLHKLCVDQYDSIDKKRLRNAYACKFLTCVAKGRLTGPFSEIPTLGELEPIPIKTTVDQEPVWLKDFVNAGDHKDPSNFNTYMASDILENGNGACAFVAVSMDDSEINSSG